MNSQFKIKFLNHLNKKNNKGFTLIELLVVVIIIGVLAAIALPNLLGQVAKGRQAEAKNALGSVNRAQQAYRLENATFGKIADLPVKVGTLNGSLFRGQYYDFADGSNNANALGSDQKATPRSDGGTDYTNDILDYTSAAGQTADGVFTAIICEQTTPLNGAAPGAATWNAGTAGCGSNSKAVR